MKMNFLYKTKEPKTLIGKLLQKIIYNNIARMITFITFVIISVILFIVYEWIINPIKNIKK